MYKTGTLFFSSFTVKTGCLFLYFVSCFNGEKGGKSRILNCIMIFGKIHKKYLNILLIVSIYMNKQRIYLKVFYFTTIKEVKSLQFASNERIVT